MSSLPIWDRVSKGDFSPFTVDKAPVDLKDPQGRTALHYAAKAGRIELMQYLIDHKADINAQTGHGSTPLHLAIAGLHKDAVRLLLDADADIKIKNNRDVSPLEVIVKYQEIPEIPAIKQLFLKRLFFLSENARAYSPKLTGRRFARS